MLRQGAADDWQDQPLHVLIISVNRLGPTCDSGCASARQMVVETANSCGSSVVADRPPALALAGDQRQPQPARSPQRRGHAGGDVCRHWPVEHRGNAPLAAVAGLAAAGVVSGPDGPGCSDPGPTKPDALLQRSGGGSVCGPLPGPHHHGPAPSDPAVQLCLRQSLPGGRPAQPCHPGARSGREADHHRRPAAGESVDGELPIWWCSCCCRPGCCWVRC